MSFYRTLLAAAIALGLATSVFAADDTTTQTTEKTTTTQMSNTETTAANDQQQTTDQQKVNINTASVKELAKVKGLNVAKAKAIVSYRKKHGEFKSVDDLKEVKAFKKMTDKTMREIQDQLTVG